VVARAAAAHTDVLCLDELHVTDVADAMLLSRLLGELLHCGCTVLLTSNRPPRDLYKGGLSRKYFEPFIQLVDNRWASRGVEEGGGGGEGRRGEEEESLGGGGRGRGAP